MGQSFGVLRSSASFIALTLSFRKQATRAESTESRTDAALDAETGTKELTERTVVAYVQESWAILET